MNISFIGMMGSGKTTVAKEMIKFFNNLSFIDIDEKIVEQEKCSINDIFENKGEAIFRKIETNILKTLLRNDNQLISTGGGIIKKEENIKLLKENSIIIYLKTSSDVIYNRIKNDTSRPLLKGNLKENIEKILNERSKIYEKTANIIVNTDNKTPFEIAKEIIEKIK